MFSSGAILQRLFYSQLLTSSRAHNVLCTSPYLPWNRSWGNCVWLHHGPFVACDLDCHCYQQTLGMLNAPQKFDKSWFLGHLQEKTSTGGSNWITWKDQINGQLRVSHRGLSWAYRKVKLNLYCTFWQKPARVMHK